MMAEWEDIGSGYVSFVSIQQCCCRSSQKISSSETGVLSMHLPRGTHITMEIAVYFIMHCASSSLPLAQLKSY